jgi:AAA domain-containing protein
MKILRLEAENVKRLHAVDITPTGDIVEISGDNANGKTSVLDAIWWALAGTGAVQAEPIRRGAQTARIRLDMGDLIVTRTFKRVKDGEFTTKLQVENAEGASFNSPQKMLDALVAVLTFDPIEFTRMKPREQFDAVRTFVPGIDFENIDNLNRGDFQKRSEANRRLEEAKAGAGLIALRDDLPDDEIPESEFLDKIAGSAQANADIERERERRVQTRELLVNKSGAVASKRTKAAELRRQADEMDVDATNLDSLVAQHTADLEALPPLTQPVDVTEIREQLTRAQATNAAIRRNAEFYRRKAALETVANDAAMLSDELTAKINARNKAKQEAIAAAQMPVEGLGFGEGFITLNGVPFNQASDAEQLSASIAIAMRTNSKLRVIRVRDGSLLDDAKMKILADMAAANGCQVWIETVRAVTDTAVIIEDGAVRGARKVAQEQAA